jgi:hypothetical protein
MRVEAGGVGQDNATDGQVIGLRPGAGEYDSARIAAKQRGDLLAGGVACSARAGAAA